MNNIHAVKVFTESLEEMIKENLTLYQSLKILGQSKITDKRIRMGAEYLADSVENGMSFSNALKTCPCMKFDSVYVSFISFSERGGDFSETLRFLLNRCIRQEENRNSVFSALVYPLFVVFLVIGICVFFVCSGDLFGEMMFPGIEKKEAVKSIIYGFITFLLIGGGLVCLIFKVMGEDKLYEAFLAGGFLTKNGMGLSQACSMASIVLEVDSKKGKIFQSAREGLEYGMDLRSAFSREKNMRLQKKIEMALLIAEKTGDKDEVLMKIANSIKNEKERRRKYCMTLVEPAFIVLTGVFLMGIVINLVLPVFSETGIL